MCGPTTTTPTSNSWAKARRRSPAINRKKLPRYQQEKVTSVLVGKSDLGINWNKLSIADNKLGISRNNPGIKRNNPRITVNQLGITKNNYYYVI